MGKKTGLRKNLKLTLIMSLGYTAHSIWDSSHKQIGGTQKRKEKKNIYVYQKDILNFKEKTVSVCVKLSMSQCMSLFLDMKLMSSI